MINWIIGHRVLEKYSKIWIIIITGRLKTLSKTWYCQLFWMRNWGAEMTTPCLNDILLIIFTEKRNGHRGLKVVPKLPKTFQNKKLFSLRSKTATEVYRRAGTADLLILGKADAGLPSTCCWFVMMIMIMGGGITTQHVANEMIVKKWYCWKIKGFLNPTLS